MGRFIRGGVIRIGKHQGTRVADAWTSYLKWMDANLDLDITEKREIQAELSMRAQAGSVAGLFGAIRPDEKG